MSGKKPNVFGREKDLGFFRSVTKEAAHIFLRELHFHLIDRERTVKDKLYGEAKNIHYVDYWVRGKVEILPKKSILTKFGITEPRDLLVFVDVGVIKEGTGDADGEDNRFARDNGGYPTPKEGDVIIVEGEPNIIVDVQKHDYYWHLEEHLTFMFGCNRKPERSINDALLVDEENVAGPSETPYYDDYFPGEE
jgi:hypothetical protein